MVSEVNKSRLEKGYVLAMVCSICGKEILTIAGENAIEDHIDADKGMGDGPYEEIDYYEPFCHCGCIERLSNILDRENFNLNEARAELNELLAIMIMDGVE